MRAWILHGKTVMITGATSGIGLATATALAGMGAALVLLGRSANKTEAAMATIKHRCPDADVEFLQADLGSLVEVKAAADAFLQTRRPLHVLINNAGVINTERRLSRDGFEEMFAVNHLAHFLLTTTLLPRLRESAPARIVHVASKAHEFCRAINFDDLDHTREFATFRVYGHSKLANILFSAELARRMRGAQISSNCFHPGTVATGMGTNNGVLGKILPRLIKPFIRTAEKGAATSVYLAADPVVDGVTGKYFFDCSEIEPQAWARDVAAAGRLWSVSEKLIESSIGTVAQSAKLRNRRSRPHEALSDSQSATANRPADQAGSQTG